jgi:protein-S-isoprenylcysteine O-methyltransferase Ste14
LYSIHTLGAYFRGTVHVQDGHRVICHGPYRLLRHPSYAGGLLGVLGFGLTSGNLAAAGVLLAFLLVGMLYRIQVEERLLRTELGDAYRDYADRTARLIPGLW